MNADGRCAANADRASKQKSSSAAAVQPLGRKIFQAVGDGAEVPCGA
jgi:hypothetical protein